MSDILDLRVLVLNKNYNAIATTSVREAFIKLYNNLAEVVTVEDGAYANHDFESWADVSEYRLAFEAEREKHDEFVFTPSLTLVVPRVIRSLTYEKYPKRTIKLTRRNIYFRDHNTCQYCGKKFHKLENLNIDHVIPRSQGGTTTWENVVCSCFSCNTKKGGRTPAQANMKLITLPRKPSENPTLIIHLNDKRYSSWKNFISDKYWTVELDS